MEAAYVEAQEGHWQVHRHDLFFEKELQDGTRKHATQDDHGSGRPQSNVLIFTDDIEGMELHEDVSSFANAVRSSSAHLM